MNQTMLGQQLLQLVQMAAFGWCLMLTAEEKRALSLCGRWSYRQKMIGDFLFCLLWGLLFWLFLMWLNGGLLRNYIFIGLLAGVGLYQVIGARLCSRFCMGLARAILFVWRWGARILSAPWRLFKRVWKIGFGRCRRMFLKKFPRETQELAAITENNKENENKFST